MNAEETELTQGKTQAESGEDGHGKHKD